MAKIKEQQPQAKKKKLKIVLIALLLALLVAGGAVGAYLALAPKESFDVHYKIKVHATVSGYYTWAGQEKEIGSITFDPKDKNQEANQRFEVGHIRLSAAYKEIEFTYNFENLDNKEMKVTLIDGTVKDNISIKYTVYRDVLPVEGNPEAGFIVAPSEKWTVKVKVAVVNLENNAVYRSDSQNLFTWAIVKVEG